VKGLRHRTAVERLGLPGVAGSAALHVLALATFLAAGGIKPRPRQPPVYRVNLVAALGTAPAAEPAGPAAAARPAPAPRAAPKPPARPAPRERTPAVPLKPPTRAASTPAASPKPAAPAPSTPAPAAKGATPPSPAAPSGTPGMPSGSPGGSDVATIRTEGVEFPFPGYLHNLVSQVYRRWSPPPSNARLEAEIFFLVHRDGSVTGLQFVRRSGSFSFDLEAQGALEAAARAGAFGSLPAGYGPDVLPVSFYFNPGSGR